MKRSGRPAGGALLPVEQHAAVAGRYKVSAFGQCRKIERRLRIALLVDSDRHALPGGIEDCNSLCCALDDKIAGRGIGVDPDGGGRRLIDMHRYGFGDRDPAIEINLL